MADRQLVPVTARPERPGRGAGSVRFQVDERPRCKSLGDYLGDDVPCDQHEGHRGKHLWQKPMSFEEFEWTNQSRAVRRAK